MKQKHILLLLALISLTFTQVNTQTLGSLDFNGDDNYVEIPNSPLNVIGETDFTFEAWINGNESEQMDHPVIFSNRSEDSFGGGILFFLHNQWGSSQHKMLSFQIDATNYFAMNNGPYNSSLLDNRCHHVALSREGNKLSFYIDGALIKTIAPPNLGSISFNSPLWIGKDKATNNTFNGIISQCRIWNVARTQNQIDENKAVSLQGNEPGLLAYWEMDNENSQNMTDKTGQFDGILGGSVQAENQDPTWSTDGCIETSISSIEEHKQEDFITISPNPTSGVITVNQTKAEKVNINIISANGIPLLTKNLNTSIFSIDISHFSKGIYFLQAQLDDYILTRKIIKL